MILNTALMGISPLCVWLSSLQKNDEIKKVTDAFTELIHPNKLLQSVAFLFCVAVKYLITHPSDQNRAQKAFDMALALSNSSLVNESLDEDHPANVHTEENYYEEADAEDFTHVCRNWLRQTKALFENEEPILRSRYNCRETTWDVMHPFILAFYFLL